MSKYVYELIDQTDDEMYYTIGIFSSLQKALKHIARYDKLECDGGQYISENNREYCWPDCEMELLQIRELQIDALDVTTSIRVVCKITREKEYVEQLDEHRYISKINYMENQTNE